MQYIEASSCILTFVDLSADKHADAKTVYSKRFEHFSKLKRIRLQEKCSSCWSSKPKLDTQFKEAQTKEQSPKTRMETPEKAL